jgi:uncharacterized protein (TIGR00297 family)
MTGWEFATARQFWIAAAVTFVFTGLARWLRGVSISGSLAGAGVCFVIYAAAGPGGVAVLAVVFALTWTSTRFGYSRKKRLGTAENQQGRTAWQVLANLGVAAGCAAAYAFRGNAIFMLGAAAALSEAAADTVSSEIGQAHGKSARMITTWQPVAPGTSGGISGTGTAFGLAAAVLISMISMWVGLLPKKWLGISVLAAVLGMLTDSLLGATLERKTVLNNNWVNFLSTLLAAVVATFLA